MTSPIIRKASGPQWNTDAPVSLRDLGRRSVNTPNYASAWDNTGTYNPNLNMQIPQGLIRSRQVLGEQFGGTGGPLANALARQSALAGQAQIAQAARPSAGGIQGLLRNAGPNAGVFAGGVGRDLARAKALRKSRTQALKGAAHAGDVMSEIGLDNIDRMAGRRNIETKRDWNTFNNLVRHRAGQDLAEAIKNAPRPRRRRKFLGLF